MVNWLSKVIKNYLNYNSYTSVRCICIWLFRAARDFSYVTVGFDQLIRGLGRFQLCECLHSYIFHKGLLHLAPGFRPLLVASVAFISWPSSTFVKIVKESSQFPTWLWYIKLFLCFSPYNFRKKEIFCLIKHAIDINIHERWSWLSEWY